MSASGPSGPLVHICFVFGSYSLMLPVSGPNFLSIKMYSATCEWPEFYVNKGVFCSVLFLLVLYNKIGMVHCQGAHLSGKSQGNLFLLQGQGKVREF